MELRFEKFDEGVIIVAVMGLRLEPATVIDILGIDNVTHYSIQAIRSYQPVDIRKFGQEPYEPFAIVGTKLFIHYQDDQFAAHIPLITTQSVRVIAACASDSPFRAIRSSVLDCIANNTWERDVLGEVRLLIEKIGAPPCVSFDDVSIRDRFLSLRFSLTALLQGDLSY